MASHLDEVTTCIHYLEQQAFAKPLVHIIDREADSIGHIRQWQENDVYGYYAPKITPPSALQTCAQIANSLTFNKRREVSYHGKAQWQWVAEASIVITRGASVRKNQKRTTVRRSTFSGQQSDVRYGRKFGAMAVDNQRANRLSQ